MGASPATALGADWALDLGERHRSERNGQQKPGPIAGASRKAGATGLEPATSGVTGRRSNQLSYAPCEGRSKYGKRNFSPRAATFRELVSLGRWNRTPGGRTQPGRGCVVGISDGDPGSGSPSWLTGRTARVSRFAAQELHRGRLRTRENAVAADPDRPHPLNRLCAHRRC
jgi:hypothetical protein